MATCRQEAGCTYGLSNTTLPMVFRGCLGLRGFSGFRMFKAKIGKVPGKPGLQVTFLITVTSDFRDRRHLMTLELDSFTLVN